jgi:hypothetical protein
LKAGLLLGAGAFFAFTAGCGAPPVHDGASAGGGAGDEAEATLAHKCTRCHARPERMKHPRSELGAVFARHQKRIALTAEQWQSMIDWLGRPDETPAIR